MSRVPHLSPKKSQDHLSSSASYGRLRRLPSSPSLAVGLPPDLPDGSIMTPLRARAGASAAGTPRSTRKSKRGDVSSSAASSEAEPDNTDDDLAGTPRTPRRSQRIQDVTPKRKVLAQMEPASVGRAVAGKKRDTLQARLFQAAGTGIKKSRSAEHGLDEEEKARPGVVEYADVQHGTPRLVKGKDRALPPGDKVTVCVRIKPTSSEFLSRAYQTSSSALILTDDHPSVKKRGGRIPGRDDGIVYNFDKLLQFPEQTPDLYEEKVAPLVQRAMDGFNSTIFAYGQTGSGKSHTMTGTDEESGIIPCAVDGVFDAINAEPDRAYLLRVSYIEIYNEALRDLLNPKKNLTDAEKPSIYASKGKVYVDPLVEQVVSTPQDVIDLLEKGNAGRKTAATDWNERSSRSHSVFTLIIESKPRDGNGAGDVRLSRLNLIDLAGSEKAVSDAERRGEGKHINRSLLALREVINKLTEKKRGHIPYRDSKLTHLLENALGGDSNICVICTMSAEEQHCAETLETLKFADRCSMVETKAKQNIVASSEKALILAKDKEIEELKAKLVSLRNGAISPAMGNPPLPGAESSEEMNNLADSVAQLEARKAKLRDKLAKLNAEILTSEIPRSMAHCPLGPPRKKSRVSAFVVTAADQAGRLGIGRPRRMVSGGRRAFSSMVRPSREESLPSVGEAVESLGTSEFDAETIAILRQQLREKDAELFQLMDQLAAGCGHDDAINEKNEQLENLGLALESLQQSHAALESSKRQVQEEHDTAARDFHAQLESTRSELARTLEEKSKKTDELEATILELRKSREELVLEGEGRVEEQTQNLESEVQKGRKLEDELKKLREEAKALRENVDQREDMAKQDVTRLQKELEEINTVRAELEAGLKTRDEAAQSTKAAHMELQNELDSARQEARKASEDLERYQKAAIDSESAVITELRAELAAVRKAQEAEAAVFQADKTSLTAKLENLQTVENDLRVQLKRQEQATQEMEARVKAAESTAGDSNAERQRFIDDLEHVRKALEGEKKEGYDLKAANRDLQARVNEANRNAEHMKIALEGQKGKANEAEGKLESVMREKAAAEQQIRGLTGDIEDRKKALDEQKSSYGLLEQELWAIKAGKDEVSTRESTLQSTFQQLSEDLKVAKAELANTRQKLDHAEWEAKDVSTSLGKERQKSERLAKEVAGLKSMATIDQRSGTRIASGSQGGSLSSRNRTTTLPSLTNPDHLDNLRATVLKSGAPHDPHSAIAQLRTKEGEEIDRLEKIVEAQKAMIDTQREKIKFWAGELEQQREIVRALTANPGSSPLASTGANRGGRRASHGKSRSLMDASPSHLRDTNDENQPPFAPLLAGEGSRGGRADSAYQSLAKTKGKGMSSTFRAFNLALPTSPSPLPMHPSQYDNRQTRRQRRQTIEHEVGKLEGESKVAERKKMFDSPEKQPLTPTSKIHLRVEAPDSLPRQRRP